MIPNLYPADELALIRAHKKRLEDREKEIKRGYLTGQLNPVGYEVTVEVKVALHRVLLKDRLPNSIKDDPQYWEDREVRSVVLRKIGRRGVTTIPHGARANPM